MAPGMLAKRFKKGQSGNPNGRPKGARNAPKNRLQPALKAELLALLAELRRDWPHCETPEQIAQVYGREEGRLARRVTDAIAAVEAVRS
jgi:hypothetical protein